MKAIDRLTEAHAAAQAGRHDEALNEYIWFHDNALAESRALRGVRLSFALAFWKELGEAYPPAMDALIGLRDRKVAILAAGVEDRGLFNDVSALNETLGDDRSTYDLFKRIHHNSPDFAEDCIRLAMPALVACEDFHFARSFFDDPRSLTQQLIETLNGNVILASERSTSEEQVRMREAFTQLTAADLNRISQVLRRTNDEAMADELLREALHAVDDSEVRLTLAGLLTPD